MVPAARYAFAPVTTDRERVMLNSRNALLLLVSIASPIASAQLYGTSPFQNGPSPYNGSLFQFDPDTLTWLDGRIISLPGFTVTGVTGLTAHPNLAPPDDALNGKLYAILKLAAVSGRVLATVDPATGDATQIGNLGDNFSSLSFREDGQLFGVTGNGAAVPETLWLIDKATGAKTIAAALGAGVDGDIVAYNPVDDFFYHWSGNGTVVYERVLSVAPYTTTNIPIVGTTSGETFGAVWDPCQQRTIDATPQLAFIGSNISSNFNFWSTSGNVTSAIGSNPDDIRGLALIGGYTCDADLGVGIGSANPSPGAGQPISIDVVVDNAGEARAMAPVATITLPASVTAATTSGCNEDPAGIPTCTLKITTPRYDPTAGMYNPFPITNLWKGRSVTVTINGTYDDTAGDVVASVVSGSNDTQPIDNSSTYRLGDLLLKDSFE